MKYPKKRKSYRKLPQIIHIYGKEIEMKVKDPVCNMTIEDSEAAATSTYKGKTYYFCSKGCKETFDKNPEAFVTKEGA